MAPGDPPLNWNEIGLCISSLLTGHAADHRHLVLLEDRDRAVAGDVDAAGDGDRALLHQVLGAGLRLLDRERGDARLELDRSAVDAAQLGVDERRPRPRRRGAARGTSRAGCSPG